MNNKLEKYTEEIEQKANRNIDFIIDDAIEHMQRKNGRKRIFRALTAVMSVFVLYVVVLNTNVNVQAFVLDNEVLKFISKPLIFNDIFEEIETETYRDELISLEFVLNNFTDAEITRTELPLSEAYDGFIQLNHIEGTDNYRYFFEMNTENEEVMDYPVKALWMNTDQGMKKIYTYHDVYMSTTLVLSYNGSVYVEDRFNDDSISDNYYENARNIYRLTDDGPVLVLEGKEGAMMKKFFVSNNVPYLMYIVNSGSEQTWEIANLYTQEIQTLALEINSYEYITDISVQHDLFMMISIDTESALSCSSSAPVTITVLNSKGGLQTYSGCSARRYSLISDTYIYGQSLGNELSDSYHLINMQTNETYIGNDTTEVYNLLKDQGAMVSVMRLTAADKEVEVSIRSDLSDYYSYQVIDQVPKELLFAGDYSKITLLVKNPHSSVQYLYTITHKQ